MKKIFLVIAMAMCSLFVNAQDFNNNYRYSFWSNWSLGVGGVYSKPVDLQTWGFDEGANYGADIRLEKQLSKFWTLRLVGTVPGIPEQQNYDRYCTAMVGMNFNICKWLYLFGDGGIAVKRFNTVDNNNKHWLTCDAGIGSNIRLSKHSTIYAEVGADCSSYLDKELEHSMCFGKLGYMFNFGITSRDAYNLQDLCRECHEGYVTEDEYNVLKEEKEGCERSLDATIAELQKVKKCCEENRQKMSDEINRLNDIINDIRENAVTGKYGVPFSVLFAKDSYELDKFAKEIIRNVAIEMNNDNANYILYGFGDYTGTDEHNQILSEARCKAVKDELVKYGVSEDRINTVGYGKSKYFGDNESYLNRRVTFVKEI